MPAIAWVMLTGALLRLLNLSSAMESPLTYSPGPDEHFYLDFAAQVVSHGWAVPLDFAFMDPLYGYLIGGMFLLTGNSLFTLFLLQIALDVLAIWLIHRCGVALGSERSGLAAAALYALCGTAIFFTVTVLKSTCVAVFLSGWMLLAIRLLRSARPFEALVFGLYCALGVLLRGNFLLLGVLVWPVMLWGVWRQRSMALGLRCVAAGLAGFGLALGLMSGINAQRGLGWTPLPYNGGIVLHHLYNAQNPRADSSYPDFVEYRHPRAIWNAYRREAEEIAGQSMAPPAVSAYWRDEAVRYIAAHPGQSIANAWRKLGEFVAWPEVPNNRVYMAERAFSPVLSSLPAPFGWLLALGVPGLVLLVWRDRSGWMVILPFLVALATVLVFFAEGRFRFHAVPSLCLGAGILVDQLLNWRRSAQWRKVAASIVVATFIGGLSIYLGASSRLPSLDVGRLAWGYFRMGKVEDAERLARAGVGKGSASPALWELIAFIEVERDGDHASAIHALRQALAGAPNNYVARYNLALSLEATGDRAQALSEVEQALAHENRLEYQALRRRLLPP